jgi:DNA-directed RNA polymerase subunit H (RpoH/RPB5)
MQLIKNPLSSLALLIIVASVAAYYGNVYFRSSATESAVVSNQEISEEETKDMLIRKLELEVINLNNGLPKIIDDDTRADSISVEPGPRLVTKYTYTSFSSEEYDSEIFNKKVKKNIKKGICDNDEVLKRMKLGLVYSYEFFGNDGTKLATAEFEIKDCL